MIRLPAQQEVRSHRLMTKRPTLAEVATERSLVSRDLEVDRGLAPGEEDKDVQEIGVGSRSAGEDEEKQSAMYLTAALMTARVQQQSADVVERTPQGAQTRIGEGMSVDL
jgi:hypothetical protein